MSHFDDIPSNAILCFFVNNLSWTPPCHVCSKDVIFTRLKKFFNESDKDGDGYLTIKELTGTLRRYGYKGNDDEIAVR